jgi:1-acyl-sn-glycerol-3-phosphate acyltransferase
MSIEKTSPTEHSQFDLLKERRFAPFFGVQFLGAFNDNVFKNALVILLTYQAAKLSAADPKLLVNLCAGLFILPFFLFSATAGQIADKYDKAVLTRLVKVFEIAIMVIGAAGFFWWNLPLLLTALFMLGMHSTLFGPVKYAYLPQHLSQQEVVGGNGLIDAGTFVAILLGTILGGELVKVDGGAMWVSGIAITLALVGYVMSRSVPLSPAPSPELKVNWNFITETQRNIAFLRTNRVVFLSILGISWFWFYGAIFFSQFPLFAKDVLGGSERVVTLLLCMFTIGIGLGSLLCEKLSGHKVEIGLVPFGSIGLTVFAIDLFFASPATPPGSALGPMELLHTPGAWRVLFDLAMIGIFGGFYIVPLYALIQTRSDPKQQARVIAGNNIMNAFFMVVSAGMAIACLKAGMTIPQLFMLIGAMNAAVALYIYKLVPEFLMRFLVWLLVHSIYRLEKQGLDNIPERGAAMLVANHPTFIDALVIAAGCRRPTRFVMDHKRFNTPIINFIYRETRTIPIAPAREDAALLERAYDEIAKGLEQGDLICIFPEGRLTVDGEINEFRNGIKRIVDRTPVPVIPIGLRGLWGSFFGRQGGSLVARVFRLGLFTKIGMHVGEAVPASAVTPADLQARVSALRGDQR